MGLISSLSFQRIFDHQTLFEWAFPIACVVIFLWPLHRFAKSLYGRNEPSFRPLRWAIGLALGILVLAVVIELLFFRYYGIPRPFKQGAIGILIGEVPGDRDLQEQSAYARAIRSLLQKTPELKTVVRVRMLGRPLPTDPAEQQTKALEWGRWAHATPVLRPNVVEGVQEPWITVVDQPLFSSVEAPMGNFKSAQLANLDQLPLPSDLLLLARCALALSFYTRSSFAESASLLEQVLASQNLPEAAPSRPQLSFLLGNSRFFVGQNDEAIKAYRSALALRADFVEAHSNLGVSLDHKGQYDAAIAEYRDALRLKPDDAEAHNNLGAALDHKGQYDAAIAELREALRLKPDLAQAHYNLGVSLYDRGQYDAAIAEYRDALRLKPDLAQAHNNLGVALGERGQYDAAIAEYREVLRLKPDYAEAHYNLGDALSKTGQYDAAIAEFHEALRLKPDDAEAHNNLGNALDDKGQYDAAIAEYREALRLKPDDAGAHYNLGLALTKLGKKEEAAKEFAEAHGLNPRLKPPRR